MNRKYDEQTFAVMSRVLKPDSNCIDVGCHTGSILREILKRAPGGAHFAFEPLPHLAEQLRQKFPTVTVHETTQSDTAGEATFTYIVTSPGRSGFRPCFYPTADVDMQEVIVKVDRLDNVIARDVNISFIKIDVEGAQYQVLAGGAETIRRNKPFIVFEHGDGAATFYGVSHERLFDLLDSCGLRVSLMAKWLAGKPSLSKTGFELVSRSNFYFLAQPPAV
jgi:FkbM family methyltransferase